MKKKKKKKESNQYFLFWIKSSRGTDDVTIQAFPRGTDKSDIKYSLERWCSSFGAWEASDNLVNYGYKPIRVPPRRKLHSMWTVNCKKYGKIKKERDILMAMLRVRQ